jgi:N-acetylmuramoyl-L-alanine amidase
MKILLDAGHGGFHDGKYMTPPSVGKLFDHGEFIFYEGVFNRQICFFLVQEFKAKRIEYELIHHEYLDIPLSDRVAYANRLGGDLYLSIHSNAGGGKGFEFYTSVGQTKSDQIAERFVKQFEKDFPEWGVRKDTLDKDGDRERDFYVLKKTKMPAILLELLFFDEINQARFLNTIEGQKRIAKSIINSL